MFSFCSCAIDKPGLRVENKKMRAMKFLLLTICLLAVLPIAHAGAHSTVLENKKPFLFSPQNTLIGAMHTHVIKGDESLVELAPRYDVGYNEITDANPHVDPWVPDKGTVLRIPGLKVLPDAPHKGIVVNIAEMRLYYYFKNKGLKDKKDKKNLSVVTFPIGIGMEGFGTPPGTYRVVQKIKNPAWYVPASIRKQDPELPLFIPPGPDNPMGRFALRLSRPTYLIHGTNRPFCVGLRASHGCIRLYGRDIEQLFDMVPEGTLVTIIYQPVKVGVRNGDIYVEAHRDYLKREEDPYDAIARWLLLWQNYHPINGKVLRLVLKERTGIPVDITEHPGI